jgi:hypothetical protein
LVQGGVSESAERPLRWFGQGVVVAIQVSTCHAQAHGSATNLGFVMASEAVVQVMFLLLGGVLADRYSRYRLMVESDLLACAARSASLDHRDAGVTIMHVMWR